MTGSRHAWAAAFVARAALVGAAYVIVVPFLRVHPLAAILAYAKWPAYRRLLTGLRGRAGLAAFVMTSLVVPAIALPVAGLSVASADDVALAYRTLRAWSEVPPDLPPWVGGAVLLGALTALLALLPFGPPLVGCPSPCGLCSRARRGRRSPASRGAASS